MPYIPINKFRGFTAISVIDHYGFWFVHDWPSITDRNPNISEAERFHTGKLPENWMDFTPMIMEKYNRRIHRFFQTCNSDNRVCFIRIRDITHAQSLKLHALLKEKFPNLDFLLVVINDTEEFQTPWNHDGIKNLRVSPISFPLLKTTLKEVALEFGNTLK